MNEILMTIGLIVFIIYAVFNIIYLNDMRKASLALRQFLAKTEENLYPALIELRRTLEEVRNVSGNVSAFTEKLNMALGTIVTVEKSIRSLYGLYRDGLGQAAEANIVGVKAGVKAGVINFLKKLKEKKEGSS